MNLETFLDERLWKAIETSYTNRNFTGAILDSIYFLSNLIRERTGLQSDATTLVGQAFGGKSPLLKTSKLETESEINVQKGVEQILRGIYQAIRNPRSHEKHVDEKKDADAIICFIGHLVKLIDHAKPPFTLTAYLDRVFDPSFVKKDRYAQLIVNEIPEKKRFDVFVEVFRRKESGDEKKLSYFFRALTKCLTQEEILKAAGIVSEELRTCNDDSSIRLAIQLLPVDWWDSYDEVARLRIENKFIESIEEGSYSSSESKCYAGALGTWAREIHRHFILKNDLVRTLHAKMASQSRWERDYFFKFFFSALVDLEPTPSPRTRGIIKKGLKEGDKSFHEVLSWILLEDESDPWASAFRADYDSFVEAEPTVENDIPF
jgi:uncharacterized protein (TIGR02391 family)